MTANQCVSSCTASNTEFQVIAATHPRELDAHATAWNQLIHECPAAYPTQSYSWLKAFYSHKLGPTEQMCCLLAYQGQRLVGVLPLVGGFRAHGLGRAPHHFRAPVDEYHTVRVDLLAHSNQAAILQACFRHLSAMSSGPPILRWRKVPSTSPIFTAFQQHPDRLSLMFRQSGLEHRIALPNDFSAFLSTLGSKFRRELFRQERRLKERTLVTYRCREGSRSVEDNFARFMAVEHSGWKGERNSSIQARPGDPSLYLAAAKQFARDGWLEWGFLEADGQDIAAQFAVRLNGILFLWKVGYQEAFANCAPSHLLFLRTLEQAFNQGDVNAVNFMARRHWLRVWEPTEHPLYNLIVYPTDLAPKLLAKMTQAAQAVQYRLWDGLTPLPQVASSASKVQAEKPAAKPHRTASSKLDNSLRPDRAVVIWGGDINLGRRQHYLTASIGAENVLGGIPALRTADLRIANLECVVAIAGEQGGKGSNKAPHYYRARPEMLRILTSAHIDIVATANNHSGDYGPEALLEQGRWLDRVGIGHSGSGSHLEAALQPVVRRAGTLNVALFSLDATKPLFAATKDHPGGAYLDPDTPALWQDTLAPRITAVREQADVVLVAVHWGRNQQERPEPRTKALAHAIIDAGADAVLGSSAHCVQGVECFRQRPILYDAGNLLFDEVRETPKHGGLFALEISHQGVERVRFIPVGIGFGYTIQLSGRNARTATDHFARLCSELGTSVVLDAEDHSGQIRLSPPRRVINSTLPPAPYTRYALAPLEAPMTSTTASVAVEHVPPSAQIDPVPLGPLTLLGLQVKPLIVTERRILWVESFWRCEAPIPTDIRLAIRAVPIKPSSMPAWGEGMDHDPCDWLAPTSRWQPGVIYRDLCGLRAPRLQKLINVDLRIEVGILSNRHQDVPPYPGPVVQLRIPGLESLASATDSPSYRTEFPASVHPCQPGQIWTAAQLQEVTGGTWLVPPPADWSVRSVSYRMFHIRRLPKPFFFVAHDSAQRMRHAQSTRPKQVYDRHTQLPTLTSRLAGAMVSRPVAGLPADFPLLQVADPVQALLELALAARQRYSGPLVAVTGTAGKSTTVAMLRHTLNALSAPVPDLDDPVLATQGNYNSRVDALALLANLHPEHAAAVIEIAQSALWMKRGPVTRLIRPTISVITEIGISQSDRSVSSVEDTARWKSRIFDGLTGSAVAVIGEHVPFYEKVRHKAAQHAEQILVFGTRRQAQIRILDATSINAGNRLESRITLDTPQGRITFTLPLPSPGMIRNAAATLAVILALGQDLSAAAKALEGFTPNAGCVRHQRIRLRRGEVTLIDDSYNATVSSMLNAFQVLAEAAPPPGGRKIAVLGRMVHLGDLAQPLHEDLAQPLLATGVELVITHGPEMHFLRAKLPDALLGPHCDQAAEVVRHLQELAQADDVILIKGSRRDSDFGDIVRLIDSDAAATVKQPHKTPAGTSTPAALAPAQVTTTASAASPSRTNRPSFTEDLLFQAAIRRNLILINHPAGYVEITPNSGEPGPIFRRNSPEHSILATAITTYKHRTIALLNRQGLPTTQGSVFSSLEAMQAVARQRLSDGVELNPPVCVKPIVHAKSRGVTPVVRSLEELAAAWQLSRQYAPRVVLEQTLIGRNIRILVLGGRAIGAYECLPVSITGNGRDTVAALIQARQERRSRNPWLRQWPGVRQGLLEDSAFSMESILDPGQSLQLSNVASVTNGSDTVALGDRLHTSLRALAEQAVQSLSGLHLASVSLICDDPAQSRSSQTVSILEIDSKPAIADLAFPTSGPALNLADELLDYALSLRKQWPASELAPSLRPAAVFDPPAGKDFALDTRLEGQLLRHAARARGLDAKRLTSKVTRITDGERSYLFYNTMSPGTRAVARRATSNSKAWTKQLLDANGLPTPNGQRFWSNQKAEAWDYLQRRGCPVVIKPVSGSWGRGVTTEVTDLETFEQAWQLALQTKAKQILVEDYAPGHLYRLFVVGNALVAAAEVLPAQIMGDGQRSIQALVAAQNRERDQDPCLAQCPIVLGPSEQRYLRAQGRTQDSVPDAGCSVQLSTVANTGVGGTCRDVTDHVHPDFAPIAVKARMAVFDPPHVGIDIVAQDISRPLEDQFWTIIEINTNPDLSLHHFPTVGTARDVAGTLIDFVILARRTNQFSFRLKPSTIPNAGIGVFALHDIEKGTFLAVRPQATPVGKNVPRESIPEGLRMYCIENKNGTLRCPKDFSQMHCVWFLNHSDTPNAERRRDGFYAKTKIFSGDEILIDYENL
ncbi:GNAT family N-acetyltransferase [Lamprobacter modestohalophilus]|uniref:GNAT family N-acetyltransferase n=1 Tax=Lamprobacter modestohalophilus TaxID=1064514 RepID=UPI002ADEC393|nr:GNAT family N-acetyltransferase [Lamprobacter modestohalophilus]MEA1052780.1 GNAT family N-acetyltransferase [Lamprobacter modestohalophilus]